MLRVFSLCACTRACVHAPLTLMCYAGLSVDNVLSSSCSIVPRTVASWAVHSQLFPHAMYPEDIGLMPADPAAPSDEKGTISSLMCCVDCDISSLCGSQNVFLCCCFCSLFIFLNQSNSQSIIFSLSLPSLHYSPLSSARGGRSALQ